MTLVKKDLKKLQDMIASLDTELDDWIAGVAHTINGEIVTSFGSGPGGETYQRGGVSHTASSPGYPPNVDTGALRASMNVQRLAPLQYRVQDGVEYGIYLEDGTTNIAPRPFVGPVFEEWKRKIGRELKQSGLFD